jgi:ribosomal protein S18 acetylase RimI-like enzyme
MNHTTIHPLTSLEQLKALESLLSASYGEAIVYQDEADYFVARQPSHWYYATDDLETPIGFIRYFPVAKKPLVQLECYAPALATKEALLAHLLRQWNVQKAVRLVVSADESAWLAVVEQLGLVCQTVYYTYRCQLHQKIPPSSLVRFAADTPEDRNAVQRLLKQDFEQLPHERLLLHLQEHHLTILQKEGRVVACCLVSDHDIKKEIIQITVDQQQRRQGHGTLLLQQSMRLHHQHSDTQQFTLSVRQTNTAAIALYERLGFERQAVQHWMVYKV